MVTLLALPVLAVILILQMVVFSRLTLLHGTADLLLLTLTAWALNERVEKAWDWTIIGGVMTSFVSALPYFSPMFAYLVVTGTARLVLRRIWRTPILSMLLTTIIGTVFQGIVAIFLLQLQGGTVDIEQSISMIILPSILLNLILALPVYTVVTDLANALYPLKVEV